MKQVEPVIEKDVVDYDFLFTHGVKLPITVDSALGDRVEDAGDHYILHLAEKPSKYDPEEKLSAETATVYKSNLLALVIRQRKQRVPTAEEQFDMQATVKSLAKEYGLKTVQ